MGLPLLFIFLCLFGLFKHGILVDAGQTASVLLYLFVLLLLLLFAPFLFGLLIHYTNLKRIYGGFVAM